jgi:NitT/TauT family transport system substrate-binding protein
MLRSVCLALLVGTMVACAPTSTPAPAANPTNAPAAQPTAAGKPQATSITAVTTAQTGAYGPFWTAVEAGYFADEGIDLHLTTVDSTSRGIAVLFSGEAQFCTLDGQTIIEADLKGADLRSIAAITNRLVFSVMVDPSITTAADLKGKRVGITTAGSSTDTAARRALSILKIDPSEVALVPLASAPNILTGMTAKQVDAGVLSPPTNTRARNAGFQELLSLAKDGPDYPSVTLGSTQKFLSSNPEVALAFVRAFSRGIHRFKTDQAFGTQALGKYLQLNDQAVLDDTWQQFSPLFADVPYVNPQGVQNAIDTVAQTTTPEAAGATPDRFVDSSFVRQLDEGGFYKQLLGG